VGVLSDRGPQCAAQADNNLPTFVFFVPFAVEKKAGIAGLIAD
jgi:hypothetical protein